MKLIGGPGKVMLFLEEIHVPEIQVVNYEKEIGRECCCLQHEVIRKNAEGRMERMR